MFDPDTVALIETAPAFEGLDLRALPQRLTDAYANIVAARIRVRQAAADPQGLPEATIAVVQEMRRLAYANEALVSAAPDRPNRAAAAFVAGTAHHVSLLADRLSAGPRTTSLGSSGISPEVSATVLFLIAEASADAGEMAKAIRPSGDDRIGSAVLEAIGHLAHGRLDDLLGVPVPPLDQVRPEGKAGQAVSVLYHSIFLGLRALAMRLLGQDAGAAQADPVDIFAQVKLLSVEALERLPGLAHDPGADAFPGPLHLASLLSLAARDLTASALVNIVSPPGLDDREWRAAMQRIATRRPYLWRNHRQALEAGYLDAGTSSAVSFPTGAGKSTLAELKIATVLLRNRKVIFLVPTLALVDQTARALRRSFPGSAVQKERSEDSLFDFEDGLPAISVMTPERCLAALNFDREGFGEVGLLVFDECHLLHPRDAEHGRRAMDGMLCVLNFIAVAPEADLLFLSAMMQNASEIAAWLESITGRPCLSLALTWKPTRQVRGCVAYSTRRIVELNTRLRDARAALTNVHPPAALKRELLAIPSAFFCLRQTWQTNERDDYAWLPLLSEEVQLATGKSRDNSWYLTPNGNQVACALAAATAAQGLKTLVFTQSVPLTNAAVNRLNESVQAPRCRLTAEEAVWYQAAVEEAGGSEYLYVSVTDDGVLNSAGACHHGLLLPAERSLHESLFKRSDGINVLVATPTLAQGINLPSEIVIIQGDSRFDPEADRLQQLEAHELLNAAGRAGRAGEASYGVVLVVPSKVVHFDDAANQIHRHWGVLQAIFSQSDQCVQIDDPLTAILDEIHSAAGELSQEARYLIERLPVGNEADEGGTDGAATRLLGRSLAAFQARRREEQAWIDERVAAAVAARRAAPDAPAELTWLERLAAGVGVPPYVLRSLKDWFIEHPLGDGTPTNAWVEWSFRWLDSQPALLPILIRATTLEGLFGSAYKNLPDDEAKGNFALPRLETMTRGWMSGEPLVQLERAVGTRERSLGNCESARHFAVRVVPELAYVLGLPHQLMLEAPDEIVPMMPSLQLESLSACVRQGFDRVEKCALKVVLGPGLSRIAIHRQYSALDRLPVHAAPESFGALCRRVAERVQEGDY